MDHGACSWVLALAKPHVMRVQRPPCILVILRWRRFTFVPNDHPTHLHRTPRDLTTIGLEEGLNILGGYRKANRGEGIFIESCRDRCCLGRVARLEKNPGCTKIVQHSLEEKSSATHINPSFSVRPKNRNYHARLVRLLKGNSKRINVF